MLTNQCIDWAQKVNEWFSQGHWRVKWWDRNDWECDCVRQLQDQEVANTIKRSLQTTGTGDSLTVKLQVCGISECRLLVSMIHFSILDRTRKDDLFHFPGLSISFSDDTASYFYGGIPNAGLEHGVDFPS